MCDCCCSSNKVKLNTTPTEYKEVGEYWVVDFPRLGGSEGNHHHTYGMLTPYFQGLTQGKLLGTKCTNPECPISQGKGDVWLPPRADCPDCHKPMVWEEVKELSGEIFTYTYVERGGQGLEIECPYYQIDVKMPGVCTIFKGYLINRDKPIKIGDKVKAGFRTGDQATNTSLDIYWELA